MAVYDGSKNLDTYVWQPVIAGEDVTAHYQDVYGNKISDDVVKTGNIGEDYATEQKDIEGYTFKEVKVDTSGKFTEKVQEVIYVYVKDKLNNNDASVKSGKSNKTNYGQNSDTPLPSTGEEKVLLFSIFGTLLLILASLSTFLKKKSK